MPSALPTLTRRRLLLGALPATLAFGMLTGATACAPSPPPAELADLRAQFERAHADSTLATEASAAARPQLAAALSTVAAERSAHASALADEITRMTGGETPTPATSTTTTTADGAGTTAAPTAEDVAQALRDSAAGAAHLAARSSGYRAGLLGSIAAACTASYQVALGNPGQAR